MRFMLMMTGTGSAKLPEGVEPPAEPCWADWARQMAERGVTIHDGAQLDEATTATTVRNQDGAVLTTDGPFAETKEQIIGYEIIECADRDEALVAASLHPCASLGAIEVRPLLPA